MSDDALLSGNRPPRKRKRLVDGRKIKRMLVQGLVRIAPAIANLTGHFSKFSPSTTMPGFERAEIELRFRSPYLDKAAALFAIKAGDPIPTERRNQYRTDRLRDVVCFSGNGTIASLQPNVSIRWDVDGYFQDNLNAPGFYRDGGAIDEPVVYAIGLRRGHKHYWHFIAHYYQPLLLFLERADKSEKLVMITRDDLAEFQVILFQQLVEKFPFITHRRVPDNLRLALKDVRIPFRVTDHQEADIERSVIEFLSLAASTDNPPKRRLYITRNEARLRRLHNEDEVFALLQPLGFEMVCPGQMSFREQIAAFSEAEIVVAVHGAALTNLVYGGHCRVVIELFPADFLKTTYLRLAERIGADYYPCTGSAGDRHQSFSIEPGLVFELAKKAVNSVSADVLRG